MGGTMANRVLRAGILAGLIAGVPAFLMHVALVLPIAAKSLAPDESGEVLDTSTDFTTTLIGDAGALMGYGVLLAAIFAMIDKRVSLAGGALAGLAGFVITWLLPGMIWSPELTGVAVDTAGAELAAEFVTASAFMNLVRWVVLGTLTAWLFERFGPPARGTTVDISA
jgi:predicted cobalt transporter CbtA